MPAEKLFLDARVVVVDDNPSNVRFIEMLLKMAGYSNIVCLTDSTMALHEILEVGCDLVLLDLQMPQPNGIEILRTVRDALSPDPFVPILIFTADYTKQAREGALKAGASDFLTKPGDAQEILLRVRNFLSLRQMQKQLQQSSLDLERKVAERTAQIQASNDQLSIARDAALAAAKAKSRFLANMNHELRTPLNGVIGLTSLLLAHAKTDEFKRALNAIGSSGLTLLQLLDDILALAESESHQISINPVVASISEVVENSFTLYSSIATANNLELVLIQPEQAAPQVWVDPIRLGQILIRIISNGVKFSEKGSVIVAWNWVSVDDSILVTFTVQDEGIGIPKSKQETIFDNFTQADDSLHRMYGGAGIGLALTRNLVNQMAGSISLTSEVGLGTKVVIQIPFKSAESSAEASSHPERPKLGHELHVLLVEDNVVNQMVATELLELCNCKVDLAVNGLEAIDKTSHESFDVVLMDIQMPLCDGIEATIAIRNREHSLGQKKVPIIALTANSMTYDRQACINVGMQDLVAKPITLSAIESLLSQVKISQ